MSDLRVSHCSAYNLGNLIRAEPTTRGVLYFVACFFPLQIIWLSKMYFTSRVVVHDDVYHRMYEFAALVVLGTAVLHIRPVEILSDPKNHKDMFALSLAFALSGLIGWGRAIDLYFKGVGQQPAVKNSGRRDIAWSLLTVGCYVAAAVVSGLDYYGSNESATSSYPKSDSYHAEVENGNATVGEDSHRSRRLAAADESSSYETYENNLPIYLILAGSLGYIVSLAIMVWVLPGGGKHKE
jgi:hypothetical protein